ncbi:hypothetical protein [Streptomyces sp. NPDC046985]|uniref:hypothetical protein n=1 Tax=Streptomyces sp. NPDC046985 TaxID=3155377 RepID=UPI0033C79E67
MNNLKIAVEVSERDGRLRDDDPDAIVHAYDVEKGAFAYHALADTYYVVKSDVEWKSLLTRGERCRVCKAAGEGS